jgi:hypothetical protein
MIPERRRPISDRLRIAVKTSPIRSYVLADRIGIHRATLSCWINRIADPANPRAVVALGRILGVPARECFGPRMSLRDRRIAARGMSHSDGSRASRLVSTRLGASVTDAV